MRTLNALRSIMLAARTVRRSAPTRTAYRPGCLLTGVIACRVKLDAMPPLLVNSHPR